jgi:hypothetical protein
MDLFWNYIVLLRTSKFTIKTTFYQKWKSSFQIKVAGYKKAENCCMDVSSF